MGWDMSVFRRSPSQSSATGSSKPSKALREGVLNRAQVLIGVLVLLAGLAIYLVDRPPEKVQFLALLPNWVSGYGIAPRLPSAISGSLPTFVHPLSFSLLAGSLCSRRVSSYVLICFTWLFIDVVFELGQGPGRWVVDVVPTWMNGMPVVAGIRDYLIWGTFDGWDVLAACLGSVSAFIVLLLTRCQGVENS